MKKKLLLRNRTLLGLCFSLIILTIYLVNANSLFRMLIQTEPALETITQKEFDRLRGDDYVVLKWVKQPEVSNDFLGSLLLDGVLYCEHEEISINKVHGVVLKSKENIYYFSVPAHNGKTAMENEINAGYKLASDNILLKANIPTVMFDDGFYRLYLFNYESDEIYGMCDTGLIFEKRGDTFSQYFGQSIDPLGDIPFDSVRLSIDSIEQIGLNQIRVYGWANESFIDTQEQNVYVEFYNDPFEKPIATYHCSGIRRSGLGEYFGEERYDFSGFQLNVEKPKKLNDEFYIRLAIGDSQHIVRSHIRVAYRYDGNRYEMTEWRNTGDDQARGGNTLISDDLEKSDQSYVYSEQIKDFRFNYGEATIEKKENMHYIHTIDSALIDGPICRIEGLIGSDQEGLENAKIILDVRCSDRSNRAYYPIETEFVDDEREELSDAENMVRFVVQIPSEYVGNRMICHLLVDSTKRVHIADFQLERLDDGQLSISAVEL